MADRALNYWQPKTKTLDNFGCQALLLLEQSLQCASAVSPATVQDNVVQVKEKEWEKKKTHPTSN